MTQVVRVMPDFKAVVFVEGQLPFNVANAFDTANSAFDGQCCVMFLHNVLSRKIYPTLLRPRTFIHNSFFNDFFSTGRTAEIAETTAL
jgi:hypothetical protein